MRGPFTPGEKRTIQAYGKAEAELVQEYTKSHTPEEVAAFNKLSLRYVFNPDLYRESHALIGQHGLDARRDADIKTHEEAQRIRERANARPNSVPESAGSGAAPGAAFLNSMFENDPEIRRCLELGGGTPDDCAHTGVKQMGSSAEAAVKKMLGENASAGRARNGVILVGSYRSRTGPTGLMLTSDGKAELRKCGTLVDESHAYEIRRSGAGIEVVIASVPQPILLSLSPNGMLSGSGSITVKGQIVSGYRQTYYGCPAGTAAMNCRPTQQTVYAPSVQRCMLGQLVSRSEPAPMQRPAAAAHLMDDLLDTGRQEPVTYGLRFAGSYASSTGLRITFENRFATLDCGKAHVNVPYTIENTPAGFVIRVQNPAGPIVLGVAPDNTLRGSGSTTVNGRLISSFHGDEVRYRQHSETCSIGTFMVSTN
jgi:hypothetical protein